MTSVLDKEAYTKTDSSCVPIVIPDERQLLKKDESTVSFKIEVAGIRDRRMIPMSNDILLI